MTITPTPDPYRRDVLARTETMLAIYERRQTTKVPGTISLVRDLADEVRRLRVVDTRFIREDDDRCPECGGYGLRGCGAAWHDGKPDTHCSPACGCRDDDRSEVDAVRYKLSEVAGERDALAAEVAALRREHEATEQRRAGWQNAAREQRSRAEKAEAEVAALRTIVRDLGGGGQEPDDDQAARKLASAWAAAWGWPSSTADAACRALTEDTPDPGTDGELIAAHDTPPVAWVRPNPTVDDGPDR